MDQDLLTNIVMVLLKTFAPLVVAYTVNLLRQWNARASKEHRYVLISEFAREAVAAAEQLGLSGQIEEIATSKFAYALGKLETMLTVNGIKLDADVPIEYLKTVIEAEVNRLPKTIPATGTMFTGEVLHSE
jgi:hypothetical protein